MTSKQMRTYERILRGIGVYKPYVSAADERLWIESYPLMALVSDGFDSEQGPCHNVKITDSSLSRIGQDPVISTFRVWIGQDLLGKVGHALMDFHGPAHARSVEQEKAATSRIQELYQ